MAKLRYLSLFSGIGGFELAIQSVFPKVKNITTAAQCIGVVSPELNLRKLTVTECEPLQTFPDKWTSLGTTKSAKRLNSDTQRYKQLGNAVCVEVVKHIMNMLNDYIASSGEPIESGQLELSFL